MSVRVRIAPSPTGDPHIGTAYIALFNFVFALKNKGQFIVRIEDTDRNRFRADSEKLILKSLKWLGLNWQEGPDVGGAYGPYRQSERLEIYSKHSEQLLQNGHAYRCFCTPERLEQVRKQKAEQKLSMGYDRHCRSLPEKEVNEKILSQVPHVVRMKVPETGVTEFTDLIRGHVSFQNSEIDDQVLMKADGFPTYHMANVVDDALMKISHVIRGEEWITSTPKHVLLYKAFGWQPPQFAHMPLLRNLDKSKISKRKNPTSIVYYQRKGILPQALRNFLGLLGWSFSATEEIFSLEQMAQKFSFSDMSPTGPVFDLQKLSWLNGQYMHKLTPHEYLSFLKENLFSDEYLLKIIPLIAERVEKLEDFIPKSQFFFSGDLDIVNAASPEFLKIMKIKHLKKHRKIFHLLWSL
jgi:glutamyl-tRNA synthetase